MSFWRASHLTMTGVGIGNGCVLCEQGRRTYFVDARPLCISCVSRWFHGYSEDWVDSWFSRQRSIYQLLESHAEVFGYLGPPKGSGEGLGE